MTPEPCRVGKPPLVPDVEFVAGTDGTRELVATTPEELGALAAWLVATFEWQKTVEACPFVQFTLGDIRKAMKGPSAN